MTRSFALWAGGAAVVAVIVAAVTVAAFPRESQSVQLPAALVTSRPAAQPPVPLSVDVGRIGRTAVAPATAPRGGHSAATRGTGDAGVVGFRKVTPGAPSRAVAARVTPKHAAKRQVSIGATSGPNGDSGLAGAGSAIVGASSGSSPG